MYSKLQYSSSMLYKNLVRKRFQSYSRTKVTQITGGKMDRPTGARVFRLENVIWPDFRPEYRGLLPKARPDLRGDRVIPWRPVRTPHKVFGGSVQSME